VDTETFPPKQPRSPITFFWIDGVVYSAEINSNEDLSQYTLTSMLGSLYLVDGEDNFIDLSQVYEDEFGDSIGDGVIEWRG